MFLLEKIELFPFSKNEEAIMAYILEQKENIDQQTTSEIAQATFSSKSSLVRIAKKLGFTGWTDFKKAFLEEIDYLNKHTGNEDANFPFDEKDNYLQIAGKIASLEKEAIDDSLALLTARQINQALGLLKKASTIHIFAASNNLLNAQEFAHNMARIQKDVRIHQLQGEILFNAYLAQEGSSAIVISYSGETESLARVCRILKRQHIPILAMTSMGENSIEQLADSSLRLATKEKLYSKIGTFSIDSSITYLLDVLYSCLFREDYQKNKELRRLASQEIESERFSTSNILKEDR